MQTMMQWMEGQVCAPLDLMTVKFSSGSSQEQGHSHHWGGQYQV